MMKKFFALMWLLVAVAPLHALAGFIYVPSSSSTSASATTNAESAALGGDLSGAVSNAQLVANSVVGSNIVDGTISGIDITNRLELAGTSSGVDSTNIVSEWATAIRYYFPIDSSTYNSNDYSTNLLVDAGYVGIVTNANPSGPGNTGYFYKTNAAGTRLIVTNGLMGTSFTYSAWIRLSSDLGSTGTRNILQRRTNTTDAINYWIARSASGATNARTTLQISNGDVIEVETTNVNDAVWHHHAITYGTNVWRLYIDGIQHGVITNAYVDQVSTNQYFGNAGMCVDEVTAWARVLSSNELVSLYNGGSGTSLWVATAVVSNSSYFYADTISASVVRAGTIYVSSNSLVVGDMGGGGFTLSASNGQASLSGGLVVGGDTTIMGDGFIGIGSGTNPPSELTVNGDIWASNGWVMAHLGFKNGTNILGFRDGGLTYNGVLIMTNGVLVGAGGGPFMQVAGGVIYTSFTANISSDTNTAVDRTTNSFIGIGENLSITGGMNSTVLGGSGNRFYYDVQNSVIGGGAGNILAGPLYNFVIGGGESNGWIVSSTARAGFIGGGSKNIGQGDYSAIVGGQGNRLGPNSHQFVGSGVQNSNKGNYASVVGGEYNGTHGQSGFVGGGWRNQAGTVGGSDQYVAIVGGAGNVAKGYGSFIGGGDDNVAGLDSTKTRAVVVGGLANLAHGSFSAIGGGRVNSATGDYATVSGGSGNRALGWYSSVGGGLTNNASGAYGVIAGGYNHTIAGGNDFASIGGGYQNVASATYAHIGGGYQNNANGQACVVAGGYQNTALAGGGQAFVGGGNGNDVRSQESSIVGGYLNKLDSSGSNYRSVICGGETNRIHSTASPYGSIGGGIGNQIIFGAGGTIVGGYWNITTGHYATVAGGIANTAGGAASLAAGTLAHAAHDGTFVWADRFQNTTGAVFSSTASNQFLIRASGGVGINTNAPGSETLKVNGTMDAVPVIGNIGFNGTLTLASSNVFVAFGNSNLVEVMESTVTCNTTNGTITVGRDGYYELKVSSSFIGGGSDTYTGAFSSNGTAMAYGRLQRKTSNGTDVGNANSHTHQYFTNGTIVGVLWSSVSETGVTLNEYSFSAARIN